MAGDAESAVPQASSSSHPHPSPASQSYSRVMAATRRGELSPGLGRRPVLLGPVLDGFLLFRDLKGLRIF